MRWNFSGAFPLFFKLLAITTRRGVTSWWPHVYTYKDEKGMAWTRPTSKILGAAEQWNTWWTKRWTKIEPHSINIKLLFKYNYCNPELASQVEKASVLLLSPYAYKEDNKQYCDIYLPHCRLLKLLCDILLQKLLWKLFLSSIQPFVECNLMLSWRYHNQADHSCCIPMWKLHQTQWLQHCVCLQQKQQ